MSIMHEVDVKVLAYTLSQVAHDGQEYGNGEPYFTEHVMDVVERVELDVCSDDLHVALAMLHDVLEDTCVTFDMLYGLIPERLLRALVAITRAPEEPYKDYIRRVAADPVARLVKYHDLMSNLAAGPPPNLGRRYEKALGVLRKGT